MSQVRIVEVGPRDGLQNESVPIPTDAKLAFIGELLAAGLPEIEATSFVSPKWVPQLADAVELWPRLPEGGFYSALVPNRRGLQSARDVGCRRIALFTAASDEFARRNLNRTVEESLAEFAEVADEFRDWAPDGFLRGYVSTAFECPYAGPVEPRRVLDVAGRMLRIGVDELSIGDTIGMAGPTEVRRLATLLAAEFGADRIAFHFHDTRGTAIANVAAAMEAGIRIFDSSAGGLGGCPYAPGAGGNLATDDLAYFLAREGLPTNVDADRLARASLPILELVGRRPSSKAQMAVLAGSPQTR